MKVYHGSYMPISKIDLSKSMPQRDFGQGFYVTKFKEQAEFWAVKKGRQNSSEGVITEFEFDEIQPVGELKILRFDGYNDEWFDFVIENRKTKTRFHDYDIVEGPVADDKIQNRIVQFLKGEITREQFFEQLKYASPSHQICFCTVNSLKALMLIDYEIMFRIEDIGEKVIEKLVIDFNFDEKAAAESFYSSAAFGQLANTETQLYKKSWQEIYELLKTELLK